MKHLPKHLRPRWRYLAVELETEAGVDLERPAFQRAGWYAAGNLLGDAGSADADLRVLRYRFDDETGRGEAVVRARRGEVSPARGALACVHAVNDPPVGPWIRGTSGTVRGCEAFFDEER